MFKGSHPVTIDAKGRFAIPAAYRQSLNDDCGGRMAVTQHWDGCLLVYPYPEYRRFEAKLLEQPSMNPDVRAVQRFFLGAAKDVDMDRQGRLLLPSHLRDHAGLASKGMLVGMGQLFELWDEQQWLERNAQTSQNLAAQAAAGELPEALMGISL